MNIVECGVNRRNLPLNVHPIPNMNDDKRHRILFQFFKKKTCTFTKLYLISGKSPTSTNVKIAINILNLVCYTRSNTINIFL